jgi:M6 family metalloprotease-like protein
MTTDLSNHKRFDFRSLPVQALLLLTGWLVCTTATVVDAQFPLFEEAVVQQSFGYAGRGGTQPTTGNISVVVLFAQFANEGQSAQPPADVSARLFDGQPGSFNHFYDAMSFGRLRVQGQVLPSRYASRYGKGIYVSRQPGELGQYDRFVLEVLGKADRDIDFRLYDNDGPDDQPDSGDDDGIVDYLFIVLNSVPSGFILGGATGVAGFGFDDDFVTGDIGATGEAIRIGGGGHRGTLLSGKTFEQTIGAMCHEFGHALGLPDLYDLDKPDSESNSAGIGAWGLMGRGSNGWTGNDGPLPFGAYSRERLGWLGPEGESVIDVAGDTTGLMLRHLDLGGALVRVPLLSTVSPSGMVYEEYLLLEQRQRRGSHYERNLPGEGVLIWHVRPQVPNNNDEMIKQVDIVSADGLYVDRGYPGGQADAFTGRDNLDFWDYDAGEPYRSDHGGNLGDATDPFDGDRFAEFHVSSNPSSAIGGRGRSGNSGLQIGFVPAGDAMQVNVLRPRWSGRIDEETLWIGDVIVDDDIVIGSAGRLRVYRGTRARFSPGTELAVEGALEVPRQTPRKQTRGKWTQMDEPVLMEAAGDGATWRGLRLLDGGTAELPVGLIELRDTLTAAVVMDSRGEGVATAITDPMDSVSVFDLGQNYPNPFQGTTRIPFSLGEGGDVRLEIYNSIGQQVATILDEFRFEGEHEVTWSPSDDNGRRLAGGVFLYQMTVAGMFADRGKMLFLGGMANLSRVDADLQARDLGWREIGVELGATASILGFAGASSPASAAYEAGLALGLLQVLAEGDRAPAEAQAAVERLAEAMRHLGASAGDERAAQSLADGLASGQVDSGALAARLMRVERAVQGVVGGAGVQADLLQTGAWLQHLRTATVAARVLGRPLSEFADPALNAQTARFFAEELSVDESETSSALRELAAAVAADPDAVRDLQTLLANIDGIGATFGD